MTEERYSEKYSIRFRRLAGEFYRLLNEYESADSDTDLTLTLQQLDSRMEKFNDLMTEINEGTLDRLLNDKEINQMIEPAIEKTTN